MASAEIETVAWPHDATRVNVNEPAELVYWALFFHVSKGKLQQAVRAVGSKFKDVEQHLADHR